MSNVKAVGKATAIRVVGHILAALLLLVLIFIAGSSSAHNKELINISWKSAVNHPQCLAMSTGGRYFGSVDADGTVRFFDQGGHLLWKKKVGGATDVLIARNGESILVYSRKSRTQNSVFFFRKDGFQLWKHQVEDVIWSGAISPDGTMAAVTTGKKHIYVYTPDPNHPKFRRWSLDGTGYQVIFTPDNKRVIVGTWQQSALVCYTVRGDFQWRSKYGTDQQFDLYISADGRRIIGLIPGSPQNLGIELRFWESGGHQLWRKEIDDFDGRALISPRSEYVAISYADYLAKNNTGIVERKVAVYGANGNLLWDKGGLFFEPRLVALSPTGESVIVSDGEKSLYNINAKGKILSKDTLNGNIRKTLSSEDGRYILLYCGDGLLYLVRVG